jgi:hypothetical protein
MGGNGGATPDAGTLHPIHCGNTTCAAGQQFCCIPPGETPRCVAVGSTACPDSADRLVCDDRTDCPNFGEVCCAADASNGSSAATCTAPINCTPAMRKGEQLCDPTLPMQCLNMAMNACRADNNSTIPTYPYCH